MIFTVALIAVSVACFLTGFLISRRASSWCVSCGVTLVCPEEHRHQGTPTRRGVEA